MSVSEGAILGGRYALGEVIGRGGMVDVYRATDRVLDRNVAIKMLREVTPSVPKIAARAKTTAVATKTPKSGKSSSRSSRKNARSSKRNERRPKKTAATGTAAATVPTTAKATNESGRRTSWRRPRASSP